MTLTGKFIFGGVIGLVGLVGLVMAAAAKGSAFYEAGLIMALFALVFICVLIKRTFDEAERKDGPEA
jgi:hypothetical protein